MEYTIKSKIIVYDIPKWAIILITAFIKILLLCVGLSLAYLLYQKCLFNKECNQIVVIYFSILSLACFQALGMPIDKFVNVNTFK